MNDLLDKVGNASFDLGFDSGFAFACVRLTSAYMSDENPAKVYKIISEMMDTAKDRMDNVTLHFKSCLEFESEAGNWTWIHGIFNAFLPEGQRIPE